MPICLQLSVNPNPFGRTFIVGDGHAQFATLTEALLAENFNPNRDRLLSTGDLIDRGPLPLEYLRLLTKSWFHTVLGNHDVMLLSVLGNRPLSKLTLTEAAGKSVVWRETLSAKERDELAVLLGLLAQCPLAMSVEDTQGRFNVVHSQAITIAGEVMSDAALLHAKYSLDLERKLLWDREMGIAAKDAAIGQRVAMPDGQTLGITESPWEPGLSLTYVGHSYLPEFKLYRSHMFIDRGAGYSGYGGKLVLLEHADVKKRLQAGALT